MKEVTGFFDHKSQCDIPADDTNMQKETSSKLRRTQQMSISTVTLTIHGDGVE